MSSTNRRQIRVDKDKYYTPMRDVKIIVDSISWKEVNTFLEPCTGDNRIVDTVINIANLSYKRSINTYEYEIDLGLDFLREPYLNFKIDVCITNPPYSFSQEFIEKAIKQCKSVFMFLPLNFLGSQKRFDFWCEHSPTNLLISSKRPSFVHFCKICGSSYLPDQEIECCNKSITKTTDSNEYAWFCWDYGNFLIDNRSFMWY